MTPICRADTPTPTGYTPHPHATHRLGAIRSVALPSGVGWALLPAVGGVIAWR